MCLVDSVTEVGVFSLVKFSPEKINKNRLNLRKEYNYDCAFEYIKVLTFLLSYAGRVIIIYTYCVNFIVSITNARRLLKFAALRLIS